MQKKLTHKTFPVGLLLENRACLIVGNGKAVLRKVEALLAAGAKVTILTPEIRPELEPLKQNHDIEHIAKSYAPDDVQGYTLVFAATPDRRLNRDILTECQKHKIPCCPVDGNWMHGDFVTPAVIRKDHVSVAISTGGQNCRHSRTLKKYLARHMDMVGSVEMFVMGISHQQLSLAERETLSCLQNNMQDTAQMLLQIWGLYSFMILTTCNRVEIIGVKTQEESIDRLLKRIMGLDSVPASCVYTKEGIDAFTHTAMLTAGLLSQMRGENHIVAQVKEALNMAKQHGWADGMMQEWIDAALHISKEIRQHIPRSLDGVEWEDAAMDYIRNASQYTQHTGKPYITVWGSGTVGQGMVERLASQDIECHWVYHKTPPQKVPQHVKLHAWNERFEQLLKADCVITAVAASNPVITENHISEFGNRATLIIDLAIPRNVDPAIAGAKREILNLDDLRNTQSHASDFWHNIIANSHDLVEEHHHLYRQIMRSFQG